MAHRHSEDGWILTKIWVQYSKNGHCKPRRASWLSTGNRAIYFGRTSGRSVGDNKVSVIFQSGRFLVGHHRLVHSPNFGPTNRWRLLLHPETGVDWLTRDTVLVGVMILASTSSPVHGTLDVRSSDGGEPCQLCSALYPMASARMSSEEACESYIRWDTGHFLRR